MDITVKVEGSIYWHTGLRKYVFEGRVYLPAENFFGSYYLPAILQSNKYSFFGHGLLSDWSRKTKTIDGVTMLYREIGRGCSSYDLEGDTPEEVEEKVKRVVEEQLKLLREVKRENEEKASKNKNVVLVYTI